MITPREGRPTKFLKSVELLFYPSFCRLCQTQLEPADEKLVCVNCWRDLRADRRSFCGSCGRFLDSSHESHICLRCLQSNPPFSLHRSCARYDGRLKDLILLFKYRGFRILGKNLAVFAYASLKAEEGLWWDVDGLVPVPLHPKRRRHRGFNQSLILAEYLAVSAGLPVVRDVLIKRRFGPPQTSLEAEARHGRIKGSFEVKKADKIRGKTLLLIDDVFTTGATVSECSMALLEAGAKQVRALTVAQA